MNMSLTQITELLGGTLEGRGDSMISGVASLQNAGPHDLAFVENKEAWQEAQNSQAGVLLLQEDLPGLSRPIIRVQHPRQAFATVAPYLHSQPLQKGLGVLDGAIVSPKAHLEEGVTVYPGAVVEEDVRVGAHSIIGHNSFIGARCTLGDEVWISPNVTVHHDCSIASRVLIHSGAIIGSHGFSYFPGQQGPEKMPQLGRVVLEEDVEIGSNAVVDRATLEETRIGRGSKIGALVIVGHNARIGENCLIVPQVGIGGSSVLGQGVVLGGQVGVKDHVTIDDHVEVGAQSGVHQYLPGPGRYIGTPVLTRQEFLKSYAGMRRLPSYVERIKELEVRLRELEEKMKEDW